MEPNEKKSDLSARELDAAAGGILSSTLSCRYCGKIYGRTLVETRITKVSCWETTEEWRCPNCSKWQ